MIEVEITDKVVINGREFSGTIIGITADEQGIWVEFENATIRLLKDDTTINGKLPTSVDEMVSAFSSI